MSKACARCGKGIGMLTTMKVESRSYCHDCSRIAEKELKEERNLRSRITPQHMAGVTCATTPTLEGYRIVEYKSIINVQVILGIDAWRDLMGSWKSFWGGRSESLERELRAGFVLANDDLKKEAILLNANAVVGVEFDGGMEVAGEAGVNDKMMIISATGTAVVVEKL